MITENRLSNAKEVVIYIDDAVEKYQRDTEDYWRSDRGHNVSHKHFVRYALDLQNYTKGTKVVITEEGPLAITREQIDNAKLIKLYRGEKLLKYRREGNSWRDGSGSLVDNEAFVQFLMDVDKYASYTKVIVEESVITEEEILKAKRIDISVSDGGFDDIWERKDSSTWSCAGRSMVQEEFVKLLQDFDREGKVKIEIISKIAGDRFLLFKDRAISLLERWERFAERQEGSEAEAINGFLMEINDDFTKSIVGDKVKNSIKKEYENLKGSILDEKRISSHIQILNQGEAITIGDTSKSYGHIATSLLSSEQLSWLAKNDFHWSDKLPLPLTGLAGWTNGYCSFVYEEDVGLRETIDQMEYRLNIAKARGGK